MSRNNLILYLFLLVFYITILPFLYNKSSITYHIEKEVIYEGIPIGTSSGVNEAWTNVISSTSPNINYSTQVQNEYMPQIKSGVYNKITKDIEVRDQPETYFIFPLIILLGSILLVFLLFGFLNVYQINSNSAFFLFLLSFISGFVCIVIYCGS